jgi:putative glutamine amidotransferase
MSAPIVGVPSHSHNKRLDDTYPPSFLMTQMYIKRLEAAGAAPVIVPLLHDAAALRAIFESLDGLFLAGGNDMDPATYGEAPHAALGLLNRDRDRVELMLTRLALEAGLPILAVCRGIQVLNVSGGGTLYQDITAQVRGAMRHQYHELQPRNYRAHSVTVERDSRLFRFVGATTVQVNSLHHQAVKDVAPGFRITARATDGIIEGIERRNGNFALGVQWHPEALAEEDAAMQAIFDGFVAAIRGRGA